MQIEDTGIYTCKGTNGFGSEEIRIDLIVIGEFLNDYSKTFIKLSKISIHRVIDLLKLHTKDF